MRPSKLFRYSLNLAMKLGSDDWTETTQSFFFYKLDEIAIFLAVAILRKNRKINDKRLPQ